MNYIAEDILMHYGMPRRSGRYPYGSGKDPYQRNNRDFLGRIEELKKQGWSENSENVKKEFGMTLNQYRARKAIAKDERTLLQIQTAKSLQQDGKGPTEIGRQLGVPESTVRGWLSGDSESRRSAAMKTAEFLKAQVDEKGMIDVGVGVNLEYPLNISNEKFNQALTILQEQGYHVYSGRVPQVTNPGQQTTQKVLCVPGTQHKEIYDFDRVKTINDYISRDGGETFEKKFHYPESMDSKRLQIRYMEDGGVDKDGIIELRRGVDDLSLGNSRYSQVRILVDGTHYLKGMAVYSDDMPDGVDVIFNTNKKKGTPTHDVLKKIKDDPDNPFGSLIKDSEQGGQYWYDPKTGERVNSSHPGAKLGLINKRADEGDWNDWKDALPSQFLAKQSLSMVNKQLNLAKADKLAEYDDICSLNNPTIKKHLLEKFASQCDSAAVHLQAAALPGQKYHVIIPVNSLKDNEVYAPNYENGTKIALIRYPHGGTFEIPILTVNNKHPQARKLLGTDVIDGIGINSKNAERLSGADFDGDTVMCIPTHDPKGKVKITSTPPLKGLEGFDPKTAYSYDRMEKDEDGVEHYYRNGREFKVMKNTGTQMGIASNLITDMTLAGAKPDELARAVRHSMVVIDAEKHKLDYKQSEIDNDIAALKRKYQAHVDEDGNMSFGGASSILSRAKGQESILKTQGTPKVNMKGSPDYDPTRPEGSLIYKVSDNAYYPDRKFNKETNEVTITTTSGKKITYNSSDKAAKEKYEPVKKIDEETGKVIFTNKAGDISYKVNERRQQSTRMAETDDAYSLISDARHPKEIAYADYANSMKALANQARKEMMSTGKIEYSKTARATYSTEVDSLLTKLREAELNKPRERAAQRLANTEISNKQESYLETTGEKMKSGDVRKLGQQAASKYRNEVGAKARSKRNIDITDREWEAIQAGAISESVLKRILDNTDIDTLRERATPRSTNNALSQAKANKARQMAASNYTLQEIAKNLGVSTSTVSAYLK